MSSIFVSIFGPRTVFVEWFIDVIQAMIRVTHGEIEKFETNNIENFKEFWSRRSANATILYSETPEASLIQLALRLDNAIVVSDHPYDFVANLTKETGQSAPDAVRHVTRVISCLHDLYTSNKTLLVTHDGAILSMAGLIETVARHMNIEISSQQIEVILASVFTDMPLTPDDDIDTAFRKTHSKGYNHFSLFEEMDADSKRYISVALAGYLCVLNRTPITSLRWAPELFRSHDVPEATPRIEIDLTGRARHLVFGPYLHLPQGAWRAHVRFAVDDIKSGCTLTVDVLSGDVLAVGEVENVPVRGTFVLNLDFPVTDPSSRLEVRLLMKYGSIEGYFIFGGVDLEKLDNDPSVLAN